MLQFNNNTELKQVNIYSKTILKNHSATGLLPGFEPAPPAFIVQHSNHYTMPSRAWHSGTWKILEKNLEFRKKDKKIPKILEM